jgi:acylphosphatase
METHDSENNKEKPVAFFAKIRGRVQGVGFRYSAVQEANRLNVYGWVRNGQDGEVEVWAEGPADNLALYLAWLRRGPQYSRVNSVKKDDEEPKGYHKFIIEY